MAFDNQTRRDNARLLRQLSLYLNLMPDAIKGDMVDSIAGGCDKDMREYAYASLLATYCGFHFDIDENDKRIFKFEWKVHVRIISPFASERRIKPVAEIVGKMVE